MDKNKPLEWLEVMVGAEDYVDDGRTKRHETWDNEDNQAYNQIIKGLQAMEQIEELASFLLEYFPHELKGEGAVELAIRLLGKLHLHLGARHELLEKK